MMSDLISRAYVLAEYDRQHQGPPGGARKIMEEAPAVDAVPVVRCRDCKNWATDWKPNHSIDGEHFCPMISLVTSGEWFCAYGERRDDDGKDA